MPEKPIRKRSGRLPQLDEPEARRQFARLFQITGCHTQMQLAVYLGVRQTTISDAKRRGRIPERWLVTLYRAGISPDWVITGEGLPFLGRPANLDEEIPLESLNELNHYRGIIQNILHCIPRAMLERELSRRGAFGDGDIAR